jgi:hypothetical protein
VPKICPPKPRGRFFSATIDVQWHEGASLGRPRRNQAPSPEAFLAKSVSATTVIIQPRRGKTAAGKMAGASGAKKPLRQNRPGKASGAKINFGPFFALAQDQGPPKPGGPPAAPGPALGGRTMASGCLSESCEAAPFGPLNF